MTCKHFCFTPTRRIKYLYFYLNSQVFRRYIHLPDDSTNFFLLYVAEQRLRARPTVRWQPRKGLQWRTQTRIGQNMAENRENIFLNGNIPVLTLITVTQHGVKEMHNILAELTVFEDIFTVLTDT